MRGARHLGSGRLRPGGPRPSRPGARRLGVGAAAPWLLAAAILAPGWAARGEPAVGEVEEEPGPVRQADARLLERLFAESGAARQVETAGWSSYLQRLGQGIARLVARLVTGGYEAVSGLAGLWAAVAFALVALAVVALGVVAVRLALALGRRRPALDAEAAVSGAVPGAAAWDAAAWRVELERRLAAGLVAPALEAAWWWLARTLLPSAVDPSWTGREVLERAGRRDLAPLVRRLDALIYGPRRPDLEEVRGYAARLAEALA